MKIPLTSLRGPMVVIGLTVVWTGLWFELSIVNVFWGAVLGTLTLLVVPLPPARGRVAVRPAAAVRLGLHFLWALVRASAIVAWEIVTPATRINEGIVAVPLRVRSPGVITLIANMISLTPGTLTIEIRPQPPPTTTLYVHVLHLRTFDDVRADIRHLEDLAMRAFPVKNETEETR